MGSARSIIYNYHLVAGEFVNRVGEDAIRIIERNILHLRRKVNSCGLGVHLDGNLCFIYGKKIFNNLYVFTAFTGQDCNQS